MSVESITLLINDMQNHVQGIVYEINRIESMYKLAIEKQDSTSFIRTMYLSEMKYLEALIDIEERLYKHAEYVRTVAGISATPGGDSPSGLESRREVRRGDR